ncbi:MAG TPA: VUT family protein [Crinalium sp.]|jgi:hypothetical protein
MIPVLPAFIYIAAVLGANYTATWFLHFPYFGQVSLGTFIFGLTFTQRDRLHHHGRTWVYGAIAVAAITNVLMSAYLGVPFRIILASFTAIVIAESVDTEIYQKLLQKRWMFRVASSNAVSVPLDTVLFGLIAFLGVLSPLQLLSLFVGEILVKYTIGLISAVWKSREMERVSPSA